MRAIAFALVCLACAGHARRVNAQSSKQANEAVYLQALAALFQPEKAAAAWQASGAGLGHGTRSVVAQKSSGSQQSSLRADVRMEEAATPKMSEALPFVERPAHLDGTYAGDVGFDPLNFGAMGNLKWMREAELKHGRICMLATLGYILVDLGLRAPGAPQAVTSLQAHDVTVKSGHMMFLLFVVAVFEFPMYIAYPQMCLGQTDRAPGDYGFDPLGYKKSERYKNGFYSQAEIKNGRLAMLAFAGIVTASAMYQKPFPYF